MSDADLAENFSERATDNSRARKEGAQKPVEPISCAQDNLWSLEPHVCRSCFGRIASQRTSTPGQRLYQCTNCGVEGVGHKAGVVCGCGIKLRKHRGDGRSADTLVDAGVRCHANRRKSPEFTSLYVCSHGGAQAAP